MDLGVNQYVGNFVAGIVGVAVMFFLQIQTKED